MKKNRKKIVSLILVLLMVMEGIIGCASESKETVDDAGQSEETIQTEQKEESKQALEIPGLTYERTLELDYAEGFDVYYYNDGYEVIEVYDSATYLLVPEDGEVPEGIDEDIVILQKPLDKIYLAATSAMALFDAIDALGSIRLSGTDVSGWYIDHAVQAMESGDILFAGKYSEPDYEMLISLLLHLHCTFLLNKLLLVLVQRQVIQLQLLQKVYLQLMLLLTYLQIFLYLLQQESLVYVFLLLKHKLLLFLDYKLYLQLVPYLLHLLLHRFRTFYSFKLPHLFLLSLN